MEALKAAKVWRRYGAQEVLKGLDLVLKAGAFEALMGPSGCGKSTFLHIAAGLIAADGGTVEIGGADITKMGDTAAAKFRRRHVGVVFQSFNLLNEKTVLQNVLLPLKLEWEPYYLVETPVAVGVRVKVEFAGKDYIAVVSAVDVTPPPQLVERILYIKAIERELPPVFPQEIAFWRSLAAYYLCTIGEVYKAALLRDRVAAELPKAAEEAGRESR